MTRRGQWLWLAASLAVGAALAAPAGAADWVVQADIDAHADGTPLRALSEDDVWPSVAPRPGRNVAYAFAELRASTLWGPWSFSLVGRQRALLTATEGALQLARVVQGAETLQADRSFLVRADYLRFTGVGGEVGRRFELGERWRFDLALQGLALTRIDSFRLDGSASYDAATTGYSADLSGHRAGDHLTFPFQQAFAARGSALLLHGGLHWDDGRWDAAMRWRDAGWLRWQGLPQQRLALDSSIQGTDANGYVVYAPLVSGQNDQRRYLRGLAPITQWQLGWRDPIGSRWEGRAEHVPGFGWLPRLAWQRSWDEHRFELAARLHERRLEAAWGWHGLRVALGSDGLHDAHSARVAIGWQSGGGPAAP